MAASDAMLLGRVTYEEFAAFGLPRRLVTKIGRLDYMNNTPKFVVSKRTLEEP